MMSNDNGNNWSLPTELNLELRLKMIEKRRKEGKDQEVVMEAEELLDVDPGCAPALFFLGEALLQLSDAEGALQAFEQYERLNSEFSIPVLVGSAMALLELCEPLAAEQKLLPVLQRHPDEAQAYFVLGLILEVIDGRTVDATSAFVTASQLEPGLYPLPLTVLEATWSECIERAMAVSAPHIQEFWEGLPIHLYERPDLSVLRKSSPPLSPRILGHYLGDPGSDAQSRPEGINIFTRNLSRSRSIDEIVTKIAICLEQECQDWLESRSTEPLS